VYRALDYAWIAPWRSKFLLLIFLAPELKQRMEREAKAISSLETIPTLCHLYDIGSEDGTTTL